MRIGRNGIFLALSLLLLLAGEGHVSSGIEKITLEDLVQQSDAILLVRKGSPPVRPLKLPFPKPSKQHFKATEHAYEVLSVIQDDDGLVKGKKIRVLSASDEGNYKQAWNELQDKPVMMTITPQYSSGMSPDKEKRFIIFVKYNRETRRFSFAAAGAYEKEERLDEIQKAGQPAPPTTPE